MHLRDNVVPRAMHEELKAKVKDLEKMLEVVKRTADRAANAQKKWPNTSQAPDSEVAEEQQWVLFKQDVMRVGIVCKGRSYGS